VTKPRRHDCDERRAPHVCRPLAASSIRQCHAVLSSAYSAAVRWGWIAFNPMEAAQKPRLPTPDPGPPTSEEAARIVAAAWADDPDWGLLIWMVLVTGARRGEVLALRWINLDLATGILTIRHSVSEQGGAAIIKDTKTHQSRRISPDAATVALLIEHRRQMSPSSAAGSLNSGSSSPTSPTAPDRAALAGSPTDTHGWFASSASAPGCTRRCRCRSITILTIAVGHDTSAMQGRWPAAMRARRSDRRWW
jgi:integrase